MTLSMVRRAPGQTEQQTLLPFFNKHQSVTPSALPEPLRPQFLQRDANQVSYTSGKSPIQTTEASPEGLHGATPSLGTPQSNDNVVPQVITPSYEIGHSNETEAGGHRRKRCKISGSGNTSPVASDVSLDEKITAESCDSAAVLQPGSVSGAHPNGARISSPSTGPGLEQRAISRSHKELGEERTILRLHLDSKLLSSFPPGDHSDGGQTRQSKIRKSSRLNTVAKFVNRVKLARISYSSNETSRQNIGQVIEDIMSGRTTYSEFKRRVTQPKIAYPMGPVQIGYPKPTHPFFLPKSQQQPQQPPLETASPSTSTGGAPLQGLTQLKANPSISAARAFPPLSRTPPSFPSTLQKQKARGEGESVDPMWPPRDMVHVRGCINSINPPSRRTFERRKAKQSTISVPDTESVLSTISLPPGELVSSTPKRQRSKALRRPKRHVLKCDEFQAVVIEKIDACNLGQRENSPLNNNLPRSSHPALVKLASSLHTATSSFDRGEYDDTPWSQKYAPKTAAEVLQVGSETSVLRNWLQHHEVSAVNTSLDTKSPRQTPDSKTMRKKKRKKPKDMDGFIVSSGDEDSVMDELQNSDDDELAGGVTVPTKRSIVRSNDFASTANSTKRPATNTILLSGSSGCGKTAAVYAVAGELGFEVFEINAGTRRSARDIIERVGDMTQNHLVQLLSKADGELDQGTPSTVDSDRGPKQSTVASFFAKKTLSKATGAGPGRKAPEGESPEPPKPQRNQKQSLILLEEVDILFNEDKKFWSGVLALIGQSKRPIVMTCSDERLLPLENLALHAILRLQPPPCDLAVDYMFLLCAIEGHLLDRKAVLDLYTALGKDLRATIMQLNFWCQMGVGSRKSGLDWMVNQETSDLRASGCLFRTVSCDTYMEGMGWYSADTVVGEPNLVEHRLQLLTEGIDQWDIGLTNWLETGNGRINGGQFGPTDSLEQVGLAADMRSCLDLMCNEGYNDIKHSLDPSMPSLSEKQRLDYIEGYQALQSDLRTEFNQLSVKIGATLSIFAETVLNSEVHIGEQDDIIERVLERSAPPRPRQLHKTAFQDAFQAIIEPTDYLGSVSSFRPLSFEHGTAIIAEDVAPYIRHIISFETHLEQYRLRLNGLLPQDGPPSKRPRTTRASRAAVEGGDKANIRRERWFSGRVIPEQVMATGGKGWENILQYPPVVDLAEIQAVFQNGRLLCPAPAASAGPSEGI
ncbi:uncharacterized protein GIQ15_02690 [Arthroderma uncinatum]|uniref:uncharacterized protein n=1 Tax=Arthroderma uncinatum TaxID=74035 RepID=UPI00144A9573|nr:uncharacterized protein GIQ15_02690 [Arthroderma uncinatum]KAF3483366.1 hypothetical protein GIQ15_02690 [Arthroderma uncinatum]